LQNAVRQWIAPVMIEKQPTVKSFFSQCRLNFFESHIPCPARLHIFMRLYIRRALSTLKP